MEVLVTGGTGTLGSIVVDRLRSAGHIARVLSRSAKAGVVTGDLRKNLGIGPAVTGVDVIVHCATGRGDVSATKNLVHAARSSGNPHLVYISIVGVDRIPFSYYRQKLQAEAVISGSGLPFTILRATQFHTLVAGIFDAQRKVPLLVVPSVSVQPVEVSEVADVLAGLAVAEPAGRVPDFGGPEVRPAHEFASAWQRAEGQYRHQVPLRLPGGTFRALREGRNVTSGLPTGSVTFDEFLAARKR